MKKHLTFPLLLILALLFQNCREEELIEEKVTEDLKTEALSIPSAFIIKAPIETEYGTDFSIYLRGQVGTLEVSWGDGTVQTYSLTPDAETEVAHTFASTGTHTVTFTGDLDKVEDFSSYYGLGEFNAINVSGLINLKHISIGLTGGSKIIDLTQNNNLESVSMVDVRNLKELRLPKRNKISHIDLTACNALTLHYVNAIISNIYNSARANNTRGGHFLLSQTWWGEEGEPELMIGPPSATSLNKLQHLREGYDWQITPNP